MFRCIAWLSIAPSSASPNQSKLPLWLLFADTGAERSREEEDAMAASTMAQLLIDYFMMALTNV